MNKNKLFGKIIRSGMLALICVLCLSIALVSFNSFAGGNSALAEKFDINNKIWDATDGTSTAISFVKGVNWEKHTETVVSYDDQGEAVRTEVEVWGVKQDFTNANAEEGSSLSSRVEYVAANTTFAPTDQSGVNYLLADSVNASTLNGGAMWTMRYILDDDMLEIAKTGALKARLSAVFTSDDGNDNGYLGYYDSAEAFNNAFDDPRNIKTGGQLIETNEGSATSLNDVTISQKYLAFGFSFHSPAARIQGRFENVVISFYIDAEVLAAATSCDVVSFSKSTITTPSVKLPKMNVLGGSAVGVASMNQTFTGNTATVGSNTTFAIDNAAIQNSYYTSTGNVFSTTINANEGFKIVEAPKADAAEQTSYVEKIVFRFSDADVAEEDAAAYYATNGYTLAEAIAAGFLGSENSKHTFANSATLDVKWDLKKYRTDVTIYTLSGRTFTLTVLQKNLDNTAPEALTFAGDSSNWLSPNGLEIGALADADTGVAPVKYYYAITQSKTTTVVDPVIGDNSQTYSVDATDLVDGKLKIDIKTSGYYKIVFQAYDLAGNKSAKSEVHSFKVDAVAPEFYLSFNTDDGVTYFPDSWTTKNVSVKMLRSSTYASVISGISYFYREKRADGTWSNEDWTSATEGANNMVTFSVADNTNLYKDCQFMARSGAGVEWIYSTSDVASNFSIRIDKQAPTAPDISSLDAYLYDAVQTSPLNWITSNWLQNITMAYEDEWLADTFVLRSSILDPKDSITYYQQFDFNSNAVAVKLDLTGSGIGGVRVISFWVEDQAGNVSAKTTKTVLVDANYYTIKKTVIANAATLENGGTINTNVASGRYKRGETASITVAPKSDYMLSYVSVNDVKVYEIVQSESYTYELTIPTTIDVIDVDEDFAVVSAYFKKRVNVTISATAQYTGVNQKPTLKFVGAPINAFEADETKTIWDKITDLTTGLATFEITDGENSVSIRNAGTYYVTLTAGKIHADFYFVEPAMATIVISPITLSVLPYGDIITFGDAEPLRYEYLDLALLGVDTVKSGTAIGRIAGTDADSYAYTIGDLAIDDGNNGNNYILVISASSPKFVILKKTVTVSAETDTSVYGEAVENIAYTSNDVGLDDLDLEFILPTSNAGKFDLVAVTKTTGSVKLDDVDKNKNYVILFDQISYTITPLKVKFYFESATKVYGSADPTPIVKANSALIKAEDFTVSGVTRDEGKVVSATAYKYLATNMTVTLNSTNFCFDGERFDAEKDFIATDSGLTITKKDLSIKITNKDAAIYGDNYTAALEYDGLINTDKYLSTTFGTIDYGVMTTSGAGQTAQTVINDLIANFTDNYTVDCDFTYTIAKRKLGVAISKYSFITNEIFDTAFTFTNVATGDDFSLMTATFTVVIEGVSTTINTAEKLAIQLAGQYGFAEYELAPTNVSNYDLSELTKIIIIVDTAVMKRIDVAISGVEKVYDGVELDVKTLISFKYNDIALTMPSSAVTIIVKDRENTKIIDAGVYNIHVSAYEYANSYWGEQTFVYTIKQAAVSVDLTNKSTVYGTAFASQFTTVGLISGHTISDLGFLGSFEDNKNAGIYDIIYSDDVKILDSKDNNVKANYVITYLQNTYEVLKGSLSVTAQPNNVVYGNSNYVVSDSVTGNFAYNETKAVITAGSFAAVISDRIAKPGRYSIVIDEEFVCQNYDLVLIYKQTYYTVMPRAITLSEDLISVKGKNFDGSVTINQTDINIDISSFKIGGDEVSLSYKAQYLSPDIGSNTVRFTTVKLIGAQKDYYVLNFANGQNYIDKTNVTIKQFSWDLFGFNVILKDRFYNTTNVVDSKDLTIEGIPSDLSGVGVLSTAGSHYASSQIGAAVEAFIKLTFTLANWETNLFIDYDFEADANLTFTKIDNNSFSIELKKTAAINPIELSISNLKVADRPFNNDVLVSTIVNNNITYILNGAIVGDKVQLLAYGNYADVTVGNNKAVVVSHFKLIGASAGNYVLIDYTESTEVSLEGNITPAELKISASVNNKEYDSTTTAVASGKTLSWNVSTVTVDGVTLSDVFDWEMDSVSFVSKNCKFVNGKLAAQSVEFSNVVLKHKAGYTDDEEIYKLSNYKIVNLNNGSYFASATILQKAVTISDNYLSVNNKDYDGTTDGTFNYSSAISPYETDDVSLDGKVIWSTPDAEDEAKPVSIFLTGLKGADSGNYTFTAGGSRASHGIISKAKVEVTGLNIADKQYDRTSNATIISYNYTVNGANANRAYNNDVVKIVFNNCRFENANASSLAKRVLIDSITLSDDTNANYCLYDNGHYYDEITYTGYDDIYFEPKAFINPIYLTITENDIYVLPITYQLKYDTATEAELEQFMKLAASSYSIDLSILPEDVNSVFLKVINARYAGDRLTTGNNVEAYFEFGGIYSDEAYSSVNPNYKLVNSERVTVSTVVEKCKVDVAVDNKTITYGTTGVLNFNIRYYINGATITGSNLTTLIGIMDQKISATTAYSALPASLTPVGFIQIKLSAGIASNYNFYTTNGTLEITKAPLQVDIADQTVIVFNNLPTLSNLVVYSGFKGNDSVRSLTTTATAVSDANKNQIGSYRIIIGGVQARNYEPVYVTERVYRYLNVVKGQVSGSVWKNATLINNEYVKTAEYNQGLPITMEAVVANNDYRVSYYYYKNSDFSGEFTGYATTVGTYYVKAVVRYPSATAPNDAEQDIYKSQTIYGKLIVKQSGIIITLPTTTTVNYNGQPVAITPTSTIKGLEIEVFYQAKGSTVAATTVAPTAAGEYTVTAKFAGNDGYAAANSAPATLIIKKTNISVTITKDEFLADGTEKKVVYVTSTMPEGLTLQVSYNINGTESATGPSGAGKYRYTMTLSDSDNYQIKKTNGSGYIVIGGSSLTTAGGSMQSVGDGIIPATAAMVVTSIDLQTDPKWIAAQNTVGGSNEVLSLINVILQVTNNGIVSEAKGINGSMQVVLEIPKSVAVGRSVKVYRINSDGTYTDMEATYSDGKATFTTNELGDFAFVQIARDSDALYMLLGFMGFFAAVAIIIVALKKASVYRNMKAILDGTSFHEDKAAQDDLDNVDGQEND